MSNENFQQIKAEWMALVDKYAEEARQYMLLCNELLYHANSRTYKTQPDAQKEYDTLKARFDALTQKSFTPLTPKTDGIQANQTEKT